VFVLREGRFDRIPDIVVWPCKFFNLFFATVVIIALPDSSVVVVVVVVVTASAMAHGHFK